MTVTSIPPAAEVCDAVDAQWEDHSKVPLVGEYKGPEVVAAGTARVPGRNKVRANAFASSRHNRARLQISFHWFT